MPIDQADLPEPTEQTEQTDEGTGHAKPRIAEWVTELPRPRRSTEYDTVIDQLRKEATPSPNGDQQWARLESGNGKAITPNKVSTLKKRFPDVDFRQVGGETFAAVKQD